MTLRCRGLRYPRCGHRRIGLWLLERLRSTGKPIMAIGGIDEARARVLAMNGFRSAAAIRSVCRSGDIREAARRLKAALAVT